MKRNLSIFIARQEEHRCLLSREANIKLQIMTILGIFLLSVFRDNGRKLIACAEKSAEILSKSIQNKVILHNGILGFIQNTGLLFSQTPFSFFVENCLLVGRLMEWCWALLDFDVCFTESYYYH